MSLYEKSLREFWTEKWRALTKLQILWKWLWFFIPVFSFNERNGCSEIFGFSKLECMTYRRLNFTALLLVISSVISISPLILAAGVVKGNMVSLICLILIYFFKQCRISKNSIFIITILLALSVISVVYWGQPTFKISIYFLLDRIISFLAK